MTSQTHQPLDFDAMLSDRCRALDTSGIRRVFELGATLNDPINLSIGQPDFPVPKPIRDAAHAAIEEGHNGYTLTQGVPALRDRIAQHLVEDLGWPDARTKQGAEEVAICVTTGTSGGLFLMYMALLSGRMLNDPGENQRRDEIIIPDPYFVAYPHMATFAGGVAVRCDTYPDFRMTAERIEPLISPRTKGVLLNSPGNPSGVVLSQHECEAVLDLCRRRRVLLVSDEIYDEFCFDDFQENFANGRRGCPSPCRVPGAHRSTLLIRGFGKTYGCTGWRMGYIAGPPAIVRQIAKLQQYSFVCAPSPFQHACAATFDVDMSEPIADYSERRDLVVSILESVAEVPRPGGAFYAFCRARNGMSGEQVFQAAVKENVLVIPGGVFSDRDTHFRISFATKKQRLAEGLTRLAKVLAS
ncbi:MAG: pyridoxal phosphate-dependent aminotransferase [Phycisphaerales bacterium]